MLNTLGTSTSLSLAAASIPEEIDGYKYTISRGTLSQKCVPMLIFVSENAYHVHRFFAEPVSLELVSRDCVSLVHKDCGRTACKCLFCIAERGTCAHLFHETHIIASLVLQNWVSLVEECRRVASCHLSISRYACHSRKVVRPSTAFGRQGGDIPHTNSIKHLPSRKIRKPMIINKGNNHQPHKREYDPLHEIM